MNKNNYLLTNYKCLHVYKYITSKIVAINYVTNISNNVSYKYSEYKFRFRTEKKQ